MWTTSGDGHGGIGGRNRLRKSSKRRSGRNTSIVNHLRNDDFSNFELLDHDQTLFISYSNCDKGERTVNANVNVNKPQHDPNVQNTGDQSSPNGTNTK